MKKSFAAVSSICFFYSSISFCAPNPASMDWVKSYVQSQLVSTNDWV